MPAALRERTLPKPMGAMKVNFGYRLTDSHLPPAVAAGWRHPSRRTLAAVAIVGAVLGYAQLWALLELAPFALIVLGPAGLWYSMTRQRALEGSVLCAAALAVGQVIGLVCSMLLLSHSYAWTITDVLVRSLEVFLFGLMIAPCIVARSQRRFNARARAGR
jgi:hypothetical protein